MTIPVTGATGTVGSVPLQRLSRQGVTAKALTRDPGKAKFTAGIAPVIGDMMDVGCMPDEVMTLGGPDAPAGSGIARIRSELLEWPVTSPGSDTAPLEARPALPAPGRMAMDMRLMLDRNPRSYAGLAAGTLANWKN